MVSRTLTLVLLWAAATTSVESQNRPTRQHRPVEPEPCIEPVRALTPMGLVTAYVAVLRHASIAESLTAHVFTDSARWVSGTVAGLADMLYSLDAARHE